MKLSIPKLKINQNGFTQTSNVWVSGFTLMEVMVSVSIFAIIITIGIGSLLTIYSTLQKTRADQQTIDSLSYVLDTMTRRVRTGHNYTGGGDSITFIDQVENGSGGNSITYNLQTDQNGTKRLYVTEGDGQQYDITPQNITIDAFSTTIFGGTTGTGGGQPMVEFQLQGTIKNGKNESPLAIQTTTSQRPFEAGISPVDVKTGGSPDGTSFTKSPTGTFMTRPRMTETPTTPATSNGSTDIVIPSTTETVPTKGTANVLFVR